MKIAKYELIPAEELLAKLKKTPLKGGKDVPIGFQIYENAHLTIERGMYIKLITPPQKYVLNPGVEKILEIADALEKEGIDAFALEGGVRFWEEGMDLEGPSIPFLPPITEESVEEDAHIILAADGMHRIQAALKRGRERVNVVFVRNVPPIYPYYAYPFRGGWEKVVEFDELPDEFLKKDYRNPDNYKALFRLYNHPDIFPGVQEQRKQSNPAHIKE